MRRSRCTSLSYVGRSPTVRECASSSAGLATRSTHQRNGSTCSGFAAWWNRPARRVTSEHADCSAEAVGMWRGRALSDVTTPMIQNQVCPALEEERLLAIEHEIEVGLRLGESRELVSRLARLTAEQPLRERLTVLLMIALWRCGRQADALAEYARMRQRLVHRTRRRARRRTARDPPAGVGKQCRHCRRRRHFGAVGGHRARYAAPVIAGCRGVHRPRRAVPATGRAGHGKHGAGQDRGRGRSGGRRQNRAGHALGASQHRAVPGRSALRRPARIRRGRGRDLAGRRARQAVARARHAGRRPAARARRSGQRLPELGWRAGGFWSYWTTRAARNTCARCCPARPAA